MLHDVGSAHGALPVTELPPPASMPDVWRATMEVALRALDCPAVALYMRVSDGSEVLRGVCGVDSEPFGAVADPARGLCVPLVNAQAEQFGMLLFGRTPNASGVEVETRLARMCAEQMAVLIAHHAAADEELLYQKSLLESQTEASVDGILVVSRQGDVLLHNKRFLRLWLLSDSAVSTRSDAVLLQAVHEQIVDSNEFRRRVDYLYEHPYEESHEEIALKDGRFFERYSAPVRGEQGTLYGRVWFFRDVSARRHAETRRDEFLSIASHELKTPVTALHLQIQSVLRAASRQEGELPADWVLAKVARAESQVQRLIRLINNLLDVSRLTGGRLEFEPEALDFAEVVRDTADRLRDEAVRAQCTLVLHADTPVHGVCDRLRLEQVITNLVTNATKYGAGHPIEVRVVPTETGMRLQVIDQGIGILEANQTRIFERFERAVSERQYGGLGLGLWITRQIVEGLGGTIHVISALGQGSTFTVELPSSSSHSAHQS